MSARISSAMERALKLVRDGNPAGWSARKAGVSHSGLFDAMKKAGIKSAHPINTKKAKEGPECPS